MLRDFIERKLFSLQVWCDQIDAMTEAWLVGVLFAIGLAAITWIYFV